MKFLNKRFAGHKLATPWGTLAVDAEGHLETDHQEAIDHFGNAKGWENLTLPPGDPVDPVEGRAEVPVEGESESEPAEPKEDVAEEETDAPEKSDGKGKPKWQRKK